MIALAYLCGCLSAVANGATNVMQRAANRDESERLQFSLRLILNLARKPLWLASIATMMGSFVLQSAGLGFGALAAVEPLLVLELPLTLIGARYFLGGRLGRREWGAIAAMTAGTAGLIAFLGPSGGKGTGIGWMVWLLAIAATATPVMTLLWLGRRAGSPGRRAGLLGTGAGLCFGLAAALLKGMTEQFSSGGIAGVLTTWQLYGAAAAGILAFWLDQNAVNAGRLAVAQPGITLGDPCVSIAWGVVVFHEATRSGPWLVAASVCGLLMGGAAVVLARSPATRGARAADEEGPEEETQDDLPSDAGRTRVRERPDWMQRRVIGR
jgi:hypothetical protein